MKNHAAPASLAVPSKMWAAISKDVPPRIYEVAFWKENLERTDLRHIPVMVTPVLPKRNATKRKPIK